MRYFVLTLLLILSAPVARAAEGPKPDAAAPSQKPAPVTGAEAPAAPNRFAERMDLADGLYARDMFELALAEYDAIAAAFPGEPRAAEAEFRAAECAFFLEKWDDALARYRAFAEKRPAAEQAPKALVRTGEALFQTGKKDEARAIFSKLLGKTKGGASDTAQYYLGKIAYEEGRHDVARTFLEPLAASGGDAGAYAPFTHFYLGEIELAAQRPKEAIAHFEKAAAAPEIQPAARFGLGRAYFASGDYAGAKNAFQEVWTAPAASGLGEDAFLNFLNSLYNLESFEEVAGWRSNLAAQVTDLSKISQAKFLIADSLVRLKRIDEAKAVYEDIAASPGVSAADRMKAQVERVEAIVEGGDVHGALDEIERLIDTTDGDQGPLVLLMAELLKRVAKPIEAVRQIDKLIQHGTSDETLSEAMIFKAYTLIEAEKPKRGRRALAEFAAKFPDSPLAEKALYDIVLLDLQLGDPARAIEDARAYLQRYPSGQYAEATGLRLAALYTDIKDYATARHVFKQLVERYPDSPKAGEAAFLAGYNEQAAGDYAKALEFYRRVDESKVSREVFVSTLKNRAATAVQLGDAASAARDYSELIARFPETPLEPAAFFWLIDNELGAGDAAGARAALDAFSKRPDAAQHAGEMKFYTAETLRLEKRYAEAQTAYDELIASNPALAADAYLGRGLVSAALGDRDKARVDYAEAARRAGEDHEIAIRAKIEQADLYYEEAKYADAAKAYLAIGILYDDPAYVPQAMTRAAESFENAQDPKNAQQVYSELVERFPDHPLAADARAKLKKEAA